MIPEIITSKIINDGLNTIINDFLKPRLNNWIEQNDIEKSAINYEKTLAEYFTRSYLEYSKMHTIVYNNMETHLKDLYIPLNIIYDGSTFSCETICIDKYPIDDFKKYNNRIFIVDNAGMGKSTIMKFLFINLINKSCGIPFFIELRKLTKDTTIIEYLLSEIEDISDVMSNERKKSFLKYLINNGDCIFFFDGYDEISLEDKKQVTITLQNFIKKAHKNTYIISSRKEESLASFYNKFYFFYIEPLKKEKAFTLLKKFDNNGMLSKKIIEKLSEESSMRIIFEFLGNPLMVSLLYTAYRYENDIPLRKIEFYNQVYKALYSNHDLTKGDSYVHQKYSKLNLSDFEKVLRYLGFYSLFSNHKTNTFNKDNLVKLIDDIKNKLTITGFESKFDTEDFIKDLLITVPLFIKEGHDYKWIHKSFAEYFAAKYIYHDSNKIESYLKNMYSSSHMITYHNIFDFYYDIDITSFRKFILKPFLEDFINYMNKIITISNDDEYIRLTTVLYFHKFGYKYELLNSNIKKDTISLHDFKFIQPRLYSNYYFYPLFNYNKNAILIDILLEKNLDIFSDFKRFNLIYKYNSKKRLSKKDFIFHNMDESSGFLLLNDYINNPTKLKNYAPLLSSINFLFEKLLYIKLVPNLQKCKKLLNEINNEINYYKLDDDIIF